MVNLSIWNLRKIPRLLMSDKTVFWKFSQPFSVFQVPYRKVMTFPQANSDLNYFRLFPKLLHNNE
jgi:hypothetical protein